MHGPLAPSKNTCGKARNLHCCLINKKGFPIVNMTTHCCIGCPIEDYCGWVCPFRHNCTIIVKPAKKHRMLKFLRRCISRNE